MEYSICNDSVFHGRDFLESMTIVKESGFDVFEFWTWRDKDIESINTLRKALDMRVGTFCVPFVSLVDSARHGDYIEGLAKTIEIAQKLDCNNLITQVGDFIFGLSEEEQTENLINGLDLCKPLLEKSGITLLFEPLNTLIDHKGYFLSSSEKAFDIQEKVGSPNIKVLFDIYHQLVMGEDVYSLIKNNISRIGHFHAAGCPGRHELDSGDFEYGSLFQSIAVSGYDGHIGIEYIPVNNPVNGLQKLPPIQG